MSSFLLTAPAIEPVSVADAKLFLRVEHDDDDAVIASLVAAARAHVEALTRHALITQTWRHIYDQWPESGRLTVAPAPVQSVAALKTYDADNVAASHDVSAIVIDPAGSIISAPPWSLPQPGRSHAGIEIDIVAGFGDTASSVPPQLMQAMRALIAHWYDNRGLVALGQTVGMIPASVHALTAPWRVLSL